MKTLPTLRSLGSAPLLVLLGCLGLSGCVIPPPAVQGAKPMPMVIAPPTPSPEAKAPIREVVGLNGNLTATGYAIIGIQPTQNAPQQRLMAIRAAKIDAYRNLAEQVYGLQINSNSTVSMMMLKSDTFRSQVEGVIFGAVLNNITPINNDTYEVTLSLSKMVVNDLLHLYADKVALLKAEVKPEISQEIKPEIKIETKPEIKH